MGFLYGLVSRLTIWVTTITLVLFSITLNLPNANLHKQTLKSSDFYNKLSSELKSSKVNKDSLKDGFSSLVLVSVLTDLATPGWLQNLFEQNIDGFSKWLNGDTNQLNIYIPSKDVELALSKGIDNQTKDISNKLGSEISTCTPEQSATLKREGFDLNKQFCLPENVKNGQQSLTDFMGINGSNVENNSFLNKLLNDNSLSPSKDNFNINDLNFIKNSQSGTINRLNQARDVFLTLKRFTPILLGASILLALAEILLARLIKKKFLVQLRRFTFNTATGTLSLAATIIISFAVFSYFGTYIQSFIVPGLGTGQLTTLISLEIVKFTFNLVSTAVWVSLGLLVLNLVLWGIQKSGVFDRTDYKNQQLKDKKVPLKEGAKGENLNEGTPTMDEEFHSIRQQNVQNNHQNDELIKSFEEAEKERQVDSMDTQIPKPETPEQNTIATESKLSAIRQRLDNLNKQTPNTEVLPEVDSQKPTPPRVNL